MAFFVFERSVCNAAAIAFLPRTTEESWAKAFCMASSSYWTLVFICSSNQPLLTTRFSYSVVISLV
ncbi:MAG: hypothetical protein BWY65_01204 [Firmicutes bacterium ADurb.Bin373]|nr:MAG: hypothetical protein BWY65_01204 [Firmicutes bacterium ADurb.Bin373]